MERSRCIGLEDRESASNKRPPSLPFDEGATHLPWMPTLHSLVLCGSSVHQHQEKVSLEFTQHTLCTEGLPDLGNRTGYFASFTCTVTMYIIWFVFHYLIFKKPILLVFCMKKNTAEVKLVMCFF